MPEPGASERNKRYYAKNRERIRATRKAQRLAALERHREYQRKYQAKNRERVRSRCRAWWHAGGKFKHEEARLKRKYGITPAQREDLFLNQNGKCAICGDAMLHWKQLRKAKNATAQIDHDHLTGKVRELLCGNCNRGIAHFKDDLDRLEKAIAYLRKHGRS